MSKHKHVVLIALLFIDLLTSTELYAQDLVTDIELLGNTTHAARTKHLAEFYELGLAHSDSTAIFSTIEKIESLAQHLKDRDLELEAQVLRVHYYYYRDKFAKEIVVNKLLALDEIAKDEKVLWLEARVQNMLGNYLYFHHREYAEGFEYHEKAGALLAKLTTKEFPLKPICLSQIGIIYAEFGEYRKSINYLHKAYNSDLNTTRYYEVQAIINHLGYGYQKLSVIDSSDYYFNKVLQNAERQKDSTWIAISHGNLGYNRFLEKEYDKALPLFEIDYKQAIKNNDYTVAANALGSIAEIALENGEINKANELAMRAKQLAYKTDNLSPLSFIYPLLTKIKAFKGEPLLVKTYLDSATIVRNYLSEKFDSKTLTLARQKVQLEQIRNSEKQRELLSQKQLFIRNATIVALVAIVTIIVLLWNQNKLKSRNKEERLAAQKEAAGQQLKAAKERLSDFKQSIIEKNRIVQKIEAELKHTQQEIESLKTITNDETLGASLEEKLQDIAILTDRDWREFVLIFEKVHHGFFDGLEHNYPDLTPSEVKVLALIKLDLSNKEMALILGVGTSAIRQTKSRLRKKLALTSDTKLQALVASI